jgi:hypothetical protein
VQYCSVIQTAQGEAKNENEKILILMGGACSTYGEREVNTGFWWGDVSEGDHLGDPGVDGRIILKLICKKLDGHGLD